MFLLYDTRQRSAVEISPGRARQLRMYTCGPTVCRPVHVGNLRTYLLSDLIRRNAARHGVTVVCCQNVADVGQLALQVARHYEAAFFADCSDLNIWPPDHAPRACESIGLMTDMIATLIETGHAYATADGSVYFDARSFPGYGAISGNLFQADWALWQGSAAGRELTWDSPWGTGFPTGHAECSAMSLHFLGEHIDLHLGGIDLRFPHHEAERAQSNSVTGHEVVRHWVHGEQLLFDGREIAESAGNVVLLADLAARGLDPLALRLALLEHRYRQQLNLTWERLAAADSTLRRWRARLAEWANSPSVPICAPVMTELTRAFDDDLDTPAALRALRGLEKDGQVPPGSKFETFASADQLLGLDLARDVGRVTGPAAS